MIMKKVLPLLAIVLAIIGCSRSSSNEKSEPRKDFADMFELSNYVYIDRSRCLHVAKDCIALEYDTSDGETANYQVEIIPIKDLKNGYFNTMCSKCVSNKSFEKIRKILEQNYDKTEEFADSVAGYAY